MRLFVALDIPEEVRAAIGSLMVKLRPTCQNARWVRIDGVHVTLKFIGEVPDENVEKIKMALATVPFPTPIEMKFRALGFFPNDRRPRVLWAGIESGDALSTLASNVEAALVSLGIAREKRAFSPHLTVARFDSPGDLKRLREAVAGAGPLEFGATIANNFHLYRSILKRGGAEYTQMATFRVSGDQSR